MRTVPVRYAEKTAFDAAAGSVRQGWRNTPVTLPLPAVHRDAEVDDSRPTAIFGPTGVICCLIGLGFWALVFVWLF